MCDICECRINHFGSECREGRFWDRICSWDKTALEPAALLWAAAHARLSDMMQMSCVGAQAGLEPALLSKQDFEWSEACVLY